MRDECSINDCAKFVERRPRENKTIKKKLTIFVSYGFCCFIQINILKKRIDVLKKLNTHVLWKTTPIKRVGLQNTHKLWNYNSASILAESLDNALALLAYLGEKDSTLYTFPARQILKVGRGRGGCGIPPLPCKRFDHVFPLQIQYLLAKVLPYSISAHGNMDLYEGWYALSSHGPESAYTCILYTCALAFSQDKPTIR